MNRAQRRRQQKQAKEPAKNQKRSRPAAASDLQALLQEGLRAHQAGRLADAEAAYRRVLETLFYPFAVRFGYRAPDPAWLKRNLKELPGLLEGLLDFETALKKRVGLLKGISRAQLQAVYQDRITTAPGARTLIKTLKSAGIQTALVSGGFTFFTDQVKDALGFDFVRANQLGFSGNVLDGTVKEPLMDARGKKDFLEELAKGSPQAVLAIGDGANDIPMLKAAGMSLAYHGKPVAEKAARARLAHVDLTGVLYTLGIMEKAFQR
ncbi:MAG: HAD-IB family phosphatase [Proteobacteria bacterium]|nr:HAD-IB family phosphatase [Pseudomonadota bacterium]